MEWYRIDVRSPVVTNETGWAPSLPSPPGVEQHYRGQHRLSAALHHIQPQIDIGPVVVRIGEGVLYLCLLAMLLSVSDLSRFLARSLSVSTVLHRPPPTPSLCGVTELFIVVPFLCSNSSFPNFLLQLLTPTRASSVALSSTRAAQVSAVRKSNPSPPLLTRLPPSLLVHLLLLTLLYLVLLPLLYRITLPPSSPFFPSSPRRPLPHDLAPDGPDFGWWKGCGCEWVAGDGSLLPPFKCWGE